MKRTISMIALALTFVLCAGMLAGCTDSSAGSDDADADNAGTTEGEETQDLVGEVTYAGTSELTLKLYETESEIDDYAALDLSTLTESGKTSTVTIQDGAQFFYTDSGEEYSAAQEDVAMGSVIAVTTSGSGSQKIIILNYGAGDAMVARVDEVQEDGTLSLSLYTLTGSAADYRITDYADVEFGNYEDSYELQDYVIGEDTVLQVSEEGVLGDAAAADIAVGDMLVIYTDDSGMDAVVIFHTTGSVSE